MAAKLAFMIIGAQKSGTTPLYNLLRQHKRLFLTRSEEMPYFINDEFHSQGEGYLDAYFSESKPGQLLGAKQVRSMYVPGTAARMRAHNPTMHIFALLREPVSRAYSDYWFMRGRGLDRCSTFEAAIAESDAVYLKRGHYAEQLEPYFEAFGRDQVHVFLTSDLKSDPQSVVSAVLDAIGVDGTAGIDFELQSNRSTQARSMFLSRLHGEDSRLKGWVRRLTTPRMRYWLQHNVVIPIVRKNRRPFDYPPISESTRARLKSHYRPHNERLADLLGRDLASWS